MNFELAVDAVEGLREGSSAPFHALSVNASPRAIATERQAHVAFDVDANDVVYPEVRSLHFYF